MYFNRSHHVLCAPEGDGGAAAAPASAPVAAPAAPVASPPPAATPAAAPPAATPAPAPTSALGAGATPAPAPVPAATPAAPDPVWGRIPEKFRVNNDDGSPNLTASWDKVADHRDNLERRMGAGDAPPKDADGYKLNFPEALADKFKADEMAASPKFQSWRDEMHKAGLSQKQFDQAFGSMLTLGLSQQQGTVALDETGCVAELTKTWADPGERQQNLSAAFRAASTFGNIDSLMAKYGNDPDFIRFAAKVGAELSQDTSVGNTAQPVGDGVKQEHESLAKWLHSNPVTSPEYEQKRTRYTQLGEKMWGTGPKGVGSMSFGTLS